jgi:RNA polymerase sigma factor (TIGR02999 family)
VSDKLREMIEAVYPELRRIARNKLNRESANSPFSPTALTNEVLVRILRRERAGEDADKLVRDGILEMRSVLIDHARKYKLEAQAATPQAPPDIADRRAAFEIAVHIEMLLNRLQEESPRAAEVVRLLYFLGLTQEETARFLGLTVRSVQRDWTEAREWLKKNWTLEK